MTTIIIDKDRMLGALTEAVAERGEDYVYEKVGDGEAVGCRYEAAGAPSCGVGLALFKLGVSIETLQELDLRGYVEDSGVQDALQVADVHMSNEAIMVAHKFQFDQDGGHTWGEALERASS